jgi:superfamily II DNA or RNA helicase
VIAVHAIWSRDSQLCVWGEASGLPARAPKRRGRRPAKPRPRRHPFACAAQELVGGLDALGVSLGSGSHIERDLYLMLPSFDDGPQHSPQLLLAAEDRGPEGPVLLHPWVVPAIGLAPAEALEVLLALPTTGFTGGAPLPPGLALGDSLRFLTEASKLALELVARGRLLPGLARRDVGWVACWRPVTIDPSDAERVRLLSASVPPLVRAELSFSEEGNAPEAVVGDLLGAVVDACARRFLPGGFHETRAGRRSKRAPTVVEAWLAALTDADPVVHAEELQLAALAERIDEWRQAGERYAEHRTFRTCFRLSEPNESAECPDSWRVEILLQAKDDPSLIVRAEEVWSSNGNGLNAFGRRIADPQERLLGGLGHALRLWPDLEPALREAAPTGVDLTSEAVIAFVRDAAPALEQAGFGVLAPPWWSQRLRVKLKVEPFEEFEEGCGLFSLEGLCAYEWKIAVGDATLSLSELRALAALKLPLVMSRGQWIVLRPEDVEAALAFFKRRAERGEAPVGGILRDALGVGVAEADPAVDEIDATGWLKELLSTNGDRKLRQVPTPVGFEGELRPYQQRGLSWLSFLSSLGLGACLADDMGLGKTVQLLALLLAERDQAPRGSSNAGKPRKRLGPTLLICPMSVVGNWEREAERFTPGLRVRVHHGSERLAGKQFTSAACASDLVITTYALATRDRDALGSVKWGRIALDEAQNIKTIDTKQTRAIRSLPARHRVALTGTPVENRLTELHSIMDFLNPELLGSAATFKRFYATPIERWRDKDATARLRRATGPFILRRLKTDRAIISDLPEKIEMRVDCHLTKEQATLYQAVVDEMLEKVARAKGIGRSGIILAALMKLKQVCNHPAHLLKDRSELGGRSGKLARLEEILAEALAEGDRALCFTQFAEFGHMLRGHIQERLGHEVQFLHGGTSKTARDEMVQRFQSGEGPAVFVLSLKAGGTGLNLTAANHVIHFDRWWNPAVEDQATDRAFRIGQKKNVQVRKLTCVGTLEERIDTLIMQKRDLADRIVGTGEAWITELDTAQLRELVTLSAEAVEN